MSKLATRTHTINKSNNFSIPTKGLVKSWTVDTEKSVDLFFGNTKLNIPRLKNNVFDFTEIREYIRNMDFQYDENDSILTNLEALFFGYQLCAFQFYQSLDNDVFFNTLFTRDIPVIRFEFTEDINEDITVIEEYYDRTEEKETVRIHM